MKSRGTRREFLSGTAKALGGAACLSASAGTLALAGQTDSRAGFFGAGDFKAPLDLETFERLVNTTFVVESEDKKAEKLLLTGVQVIQGANSKSNVRGPKLETFSLLFRPAGRQGQERLGQNTYRFYHPAIGKFEMFIVPVLRHEKEQQNQRYEAVFSRLV